MPLFVLLFLAFAPLAGHATLGCPFYLRQLVEMDIVHLEDPTAAERHALHPFLMGVLQDYAKEFGGENAIIKNLGTGTFATTFRVIDPKNGKSVIVKLYAGGSPKMAQYDIDGLKALEQMSGPDSEVRILKPIAKYPHFLVLEDTVGVPLDRYLTNDKIPQAWKDKAKAKYLAYRKRIRENAIEWATKNGYEISNHERSLDDFRNTPDDQHLDFVLKKNGEVIDIWLKDDNIIVTPAGELVLIDPY